jgi:2-keto-4-pentenoate hydratase/2-oxohepta-3-ene-1,7-dioic acid hydratase in catechol pathway
MGPWFVPSAFISDPNALDMKLWVNGELMQDSNTSNQIFDIGEQIEALTHRVTLQPGDVVLTGTPAGVGSGRGQFLKSGDTVRLWIAEIGEFEHGIG